MTRPYPSNQSRLCQEKRIFNYRLSRARRFVENAFDILVLRWRVFQRQINLTPATMDKVVKATCVLHNLVQGATAQKPEELAVPVDALETTAMIPMRNLGIHPGSAAYAVRESFKEYFLSPSGEVPRQLAAIQPATGSNK